MREISSINFFSPILDIIGVKLKFYVKIQYWNIISKTTGLNLKKKSDTIGDIL